jgi:hypothetical protein
VGMGYDLQAGEDPPMACGVSVYCGIAAVCCRRTASKITDVWISILNWAMLSVASLHERHGQKTCEVDPGSGLLVFPKRRR